MPECGRTYVRAVAIGAHRRQAHGVVGTSSRARSAGRAKRATATTAPRAGRTRARTASGRSSTNGRARATSPTSGRRSTGVTADRDALLNLFLTIRRPPREDVIRAVNSWLDDA